MKMEKRLELIENDQQNLRNMFSSVLGEFKALKAIAYSLWIPALAGLGAEMFHLFFK